MGINHLRDIQQVILAPVQWAVNRTYHTRQLAFSSKMILPTAYIAQWEMMQQQQQQAITDRDNH
jgi:hypothetical protein